MCGISGIVHFGKLDDAPARARGMADAIKHRGPDDDGYYADGDIALSFRRLAIVDLETGHQPMANADRSVWVVFNGEIYNHRELRRELEARGHRFASDHSDTEVLVHGWREWGEQLPTKLNGMFAFAVWDVRKRSLFLARDRFGVKPLYLARARGGAFLFGSEVRAIHASGLIERGEDAGAVADYFGLMNNWGGRTLFRDVTLMKPGSTLTVTEDGEKSEVFWRFRMNRPQEPRKSLETAAGEFREILLGAVKSQVQADVPVMTYLSGGIDSSSVTAAAYAIDPGMRAYSCIFQLDGVGADSFVDEREFSRMVANHLGIERVELEISNTAMIDRLDRTVAALEYPRMGMAYVNDIIAERVSRDAKVVLSGMGGDEVSGGYVGRYAITPRVGGDARARRGLGGVLDRLFGADRANMPPPRETLAAYRGALNVPLADSERAIAFTPEFLAAADQRTPMDAIDEVIIEAGSSDPWDVVMYADAMTYLHGLLVIEDKLSMSHSLETRVPLLDNDLVDYLVDMPWAQLCDGETGKIVFRDAVRPLVPDEIYKKPKMGFAPPDASWYRGELRNFIAQRLSRKRIAKRGVFNPDWVDAKLEQHFSGAGNHVVLIWCLMSFDSWCEQSGSFGGRLVAG
jgi:asparagine synthase (glutamine-hydrolysing)